MLSHVYRICILHFQAKAQAAQDLLANTTIELEKLKVQQQQLQMKLKQAEATVQATTKVDQDHDNAHNLSYTMKPSMVLPAQQTCSYPKRNSGIHSGGSDCFNKQTKFNM